LLANFGKNEAINIAKPLKFNRSKFWREVKFKRQKACEKIESRIDPNVIITNTFSVTQAI
jgi:hypothetical protein